jgi:hypothetical protein
MITNKATIKWGVWSAIICLGAYAIAFALRVIFPDSELAQSVFHVMAAPMLSLWSGDPPMALAIPIFISIFLFPVAVAFGIGVLIHRIFVSR